MLGYHKINGEELLLLLLKLKLQLQLQLSVTVQMLAYLDLNTVPLMVLVLVPRANSRGVQGQMNHVISLARIKVSDLHRDVIADAPAHPLLLVDGLVTLQPLVDVMSPIMGRVAEFLQDMMAVMIMPGVVSRIIANVALSDGVAAHRRREAFMMADQAVRSG
jgi:hypothetical protein